MGAEGEVSLPKPAYIPLIALDNFIERLRAAGIPAVIDSNLTQTMRRMNAVFVDYVICGFLYTDGYNL